MGTHVEQENGVLGSRPQVLQESCHVHSTTDPVPVAVLADVRETSSLEYRDVVSWRKREQKVGRTEIISPVAHPMLGWVSRPLDTGGMISRIVLPFEEHQCQKLSAHQMPTLARHTEIRNSFHLLNGRLCTQTANHRKESVRDTQ